MGTFKVTGSTLNNQYTYTDENVAVQGNYIAEASSNEVLNINGTVYTITEDGNQGEYIGNFNGYLRDEVFKYSTSEMSRKDANNVWDAIDEIELNIFGTNTQNA